MPVVKHNGRKFILKWLPEWDKEVMRIVKKYRKPNSCVDWKRARAEGALNKIPMPFEAIRVRPNRLAKYKDPSWRKEDLERVKLLYTKHNYKKEKARSAIIKEIPNNIVRSKWSKEQLRTLKSLVKEHRTGKLTDWATVLKDPRTIGFPQRNPLTLSRFITAMNNKYEKKVYPVDREKRAQYNKRHRQKQKEKRALIREFLYKKIEL